MRYYHFIRENVELDEVRMGPSNLKQFANSASAQGIRAGFEAELIFRGLGGTNSADMDWELDFDQDERIRDIDHIIEFFSEGDFADLSERQAERLREELMADYGEWWSERASDEFYENQEDIVRDYIKEHEWDEDKEIEKYLKDEMGLSAKKIEDVFDAIHRRSRGKGIKADEKFIDMYAEAESAMESALDEKVKTAIEENDDSWYAANDDFMDNYESDQISWLRSRRWVDMSDLYGDGNIDTGLNWPHMTPIGGSDDGFNEESADDLANSLEDALGVKTTVSTGYHSAKRDESSWIFEPDGSLTPDDSDDMAVEIVSPPMELSQCLDMLPKFFSWAEANDAYANDSTGFHMSVSLPDYNPRKLDFIKLVLFLGDEYVLKQFGRESNTYTASAINKIRNQQSRLTTDQIAGAMNDMRGHIDQLAGQCLANPSGFGKYTSINPKTGYVEFRSAGGTDYFADMDKIQNTLMRYAQALSIACDPNAYKNEYAKKLYRILSAGQSKDNDTVLQYFSRYSAGEIPLTALKSYIKQAQLQRDVAKGNTANKQMVWQVSLEDTGTMEIVAAGEREAKISAANEWGINPTDLNLSVLTAKPVRQYQG